MKREPRLVKVAAVAQHQLNKYSSNYAQRLVIAKECRGVLQGRAGVWETPRRGVPLWTH